MRAGRENGGGGGECFRFKLLLSFSRRGED